MKLELLTNATVIDDAVSFAIERTRLTSSSEDNEESKRLEEKPDCNHYSRNLEAK
jgi:hypothetical protein